MSEIGNKGPIRRLAQRLGIVDPRQGPSSLNTDQVQVVASMPEDLEGFHLTGNAAIAGLPGSEQVFRIFDPITPITANPGDYQNRANSGGLADFDFYCLAVDVAIIFAALPVAADVGDFIFHEFQLTPFMRDVGLAAPVYSGNTNAGQPIGADLQAYQLHLFPGPVAGWGPPRPLFLPRGTGLRIAITKRNSVGGPADPWNSPNVLLEWVIYGYRVPRGTPMP